MKKDFSRKGAKAQRRKGRPPDPKGLSFAPLREKSSGDE